MQTRIQRKPRAAFISATAIAVFAALVSTMQSNASAGSEMEQSSARYEVAFVPSWNGATHPLEYPFTHGKQGFLTPMIGATHGSEFTLFAKGRKPSPGLERLSEMGKHDPLDGEIRKAISQGKAGTLIELSEGSVGPVHAPVTASFEIAAKFPKVSLVGMVAPSPDWFYGVSALDLRRNGKWVARMVEPVYAWDSGGDAGATYMAEDADLNPKGATSYADTKHFKRDGKRVPVGVFVFKLLPSEEALTKSR